MLENGRTDTAKKATTIERKRSLMPTWISQTGVILFVKTWAKF